MFQKVLFGLLLCFTISIQAQVELLTFKINDNPKATKIKEVIPVVNSNNSELSVFSFDSKTVYSQLINSELKTSKTLNQPFKISKYEQVLGYSFDDNNDPRLFLSDEKTREFSTALFSFSQDTIILKKLELDLKNEDFLEALSIDNNFYLITLSEKAALLHFYHFDEGANYKKHSLNFTTDLFLNKKNKPVALNDLLEKLIKIEANGISSIDLSSEAAKLFIDKKQLIFSFDQAVDTTQLVIIDLNTYEKQIRRLPKPLNKINNKDKISNSYINKEQLFTIAATKDQFSFAVQDLKNGAVIKKYEFTDVDSITFKNSNIIQIGAVYDKYRELEKTKKFLQKINYGALGISAMTLENEIHVFLGGQHEYRATTGGMGMMRATKNVQLSSGALLSQHFNPYQFAFNSYSDTQSTYIKTLLDLNFEHHQGELKSNVFDKIINFEKDKLKTDQLKSLFKYKEYFILLSFLPETNQLRLIKF